MDGYFTWFTPVVVYNKVVYKTCIINSRLCFATIRIWYQHIWWMTGQSQKKPNISFIYCLYKESPGNTEKRNRLKLSEGGETDTGQEQERQKRPREEKEAWRERRGDRRQSSKPWASKKGRGHLRSLGTARTEKEEWDEEGENKGRRRRPGKREVKGWVGGRAHEAPWL